MIARGGAVDAAHRRRARDGARWCCSTPPRSATREMVLGKFLAALRLPRGVTVLTVYMPLLIFVNGRVSVGHILVGLPRASCCSARHPSAVGLFASAFARTRSSRRFVGAAAPGAFCSSCGSPAKVADPPVNAFLLVAGHSSRAPARFMTGVLRLENVVFYLAVTYFFLLAATKTLEARRWR